MSNSPISDRIALNFLAIKEQEFSFAIYRRAVEAKEVLPQGAYSLPEEPDSFLANPPPRFNYRQYAVSLTPAQSHEKVQVGAWANPWLTMWVLRRSLEEKCLSDQVTEIEHSKDEFSREIAFVLKTHEAGVREVVCVRPYELKALGRFGFLIHFSLRVPRESTISEKRRLELSLTQKSGRLNEDFYLDHYGKLDEFLQKFYSVIGSLTLHDGTCIEVEKKLSVLRSWSLSKRIYRFANGREGKSQFFGLRDYGPLQEATPNTRLVFLFAASDRPKSQDLFRALRGDTYPTFPGMRPIFRMEFDRQNVSGLQVDGFEPEGILKAESLLKTKFGNERVIPIALVPMSKHSSDTETNAYYRAKHTFLLAGLASQFVDRKRVEDRTSLKWSVSNIGLAIFAKMGGVPWCLKPSTERCLVVGIGQAHRVVDRKIERYFAYSVLSDSSGIYESIKVLGTSTDPDEYRTSLTRNLREVLLAHREKYSSFVLHLTFSMKKKEIEAIKKLLDELRSESGFTHELVALKFNDHNDFIGFSVAHNSRIPAEGLVVPLSRKDFLLWFSGLDAEDSKVPKKPERPVHVQVLYPAEPLHDEMLRRLLQDAMNIAGANWRGFNAKSLPISIYYAKLIADYYAHFREAGLSDLNIEDLSPWFL